MIDTTDQKAIDPTSPVATPPSPAPPTTSPSSAAGQTGQAIAADLEAVGEDFKGIILALREEYASASPKTKADIAQLLKDASVFRGETLSAFRAALGK